ncbi:enoyl-CoA hydratase-related protein [Fontimonas sp. SYSU GA230001]|uniref:enoyl-CoA hydratase-related protein n=1 Tax=Fontimonas sp. SYSU GA230001 TaxID=3142450 RepID=UPI0032B3EA5B
MDYTGILYGVEARVALIRLNRPQALNALTPDLLNELRDALDRAEADAEVGAVVLTGEGRGFSSGADLVANAARPPIGPDGKLDLGLALETTYNPLIERIRSLRKPVIAAVNGMAAGAAANIALLCDLTIAARSAYFLQAFVNIGLIPDAGGTWILPRLVGSQRAMGLSLLGERLPAEKALQWGMIWDVVDDDQLVPAALALARRLAEGPGVAIERIKRAIIQSAGNDLTAQLALERELQRDCGRTQDFMEGVMAFTQKRKAHFKGR